MVFWQLIDGGKKFLLREIDLCNNITVVAVVHVIVG